MNKLTFLSNTTVITTLFASIFLSLLIFLVFIIANDSQTENTQDNNQSSLETNQDQPMLEVRNINDTVNSEDDTFIVEDSSELNK